MTEHVSAAWVLSQLAGMIFPERGGAYDYILRSLEAPTDESPIAAGDVVQLKSGGRPMTASHRIGSAWVVLHSDGVALTRDVIEEALLRRADLPTMPASTPSSEPDAWQRCTTLEKEDRPETTGAEPPLPHGFQAAGPWMPFHAAVTRNDTVWTFWRRPLRRVEP